MNWFAIALITLQTCAAAQYAFEGKRDSAALFFLYALANVVLIRMGSK